MKMQAAVFYEHNTPLKIEETDIDKPKGEELVKLAASGVCHSDLSVMSGTIPFPPPPAVWGRHEGAGVVEEIGSEVTVVIPGDHVILSWRPSCGKCG